MPNTAETGEDSIEKSASLGIRFCWGSVFGDHCSPISDTTIMSSLASSCDHIDHVKTQFPYSLTVALIALFFGIIPVSLGFPYLLSMLMSVSLALIVLLFFGKKVIE